MAAGGGAVALGRATAAGGAIPSGGRTPSGDAVPGGGTPAAGATTPLTTTPTPVLTRRLDPAVLAAATGSQVSRGGGRVEMRFTPTPTPAPAPAPTSTPAHAAPTTPAAPALLARATPATPLGGHGRPGATTSGASSSTADRDSLRREILAILREELEVQGGPSLPF